MKGWEIYKKNWGCEDWTRIDRSFEYCDWSYLNIAIIWTPNYWILYYFRQPTPVQVLVDERRLRHQIKLMQDQWRRALYDPSRAVCKKRIEAEFRDLCEQEDQIGCNDT